MFHIVTILDMHSNNRAAAIRYCLGIATRFPQFREEYEEYARLLQHKF